MASGDDSATGADDDSTADQAAIRQAQQASADEDAQTRESKNGSSLNEEIGDELDDLPDA